MTPRRTLGLILIVVGLVPAIFGLTMALRELSGIYSNALEHPLDEPAGGGEKAATDRMLRGAIIGGIGGVPVVLGLRLVLRRGRRG